MGPEQTAPVGQGSLIWVHTVEEASKKFQQMKKADDLCCIGALRVDKCEFQFKYGHNFHEMHARLCSSNNLSNSIFYVFHIDFRR